MLKGVSHLDGFWDQSDVDVIDCAMIPAGHYRLPDGLHWDEVIRAIASEREGAERTNPFPLTL